MFLAVVVFGGAAEAHHIRGIPHYSYKNNYPETPVYELVEHSDRYIITFTYYEIPGQKSLDLAVYIRDSIADTPFAEPVTFRVFGKHEDPQSTHPFVAYRNPTNIYKVGWVYEDAGTYFVRISFDDAAGTHNVLFELSVGDGNRPWYLLGGAVGAIIVLAGVVGLLRKKRPGQGRKR